MNGFDADVVVIGSGFGGAVMACRLAERGQKVLVLERGRRWQPEEYPRKPDDAWLWDANCPERLNGWTELQFFDDMAVARGAGVGGGSLIYASVSVVPPKERFEHGWPSAISYREMLPYYERVGRMLRLQRLPEKQQTRRYRLMREAARGLGMEERFQPVELAVAFDPEWHYGLDDPFNPDNSRPWTNEQGLQQGTCIHCGNCDAGCQVRAKNTLDLNYIARAEQHGAEVRPLHLVKRILPLRDTEGYRVEFDSLEDGGRRAGRVTARRVVVAAGSLGSTELLLRCRDEFRTLPGISPRLGHGWSANGDFVTPSVHKQKVSASQGPTISSAIDLLDGHYRDARLFVEDGGFPDLIGNLLERHMQRRWRPLRSRFGLLFNALARRVRARDPLDRVMLWFGQAVDAADGRFYLGRRWYAPWRRQLKLDWDISRSEATMAAMADLHSELARASGGSAFVPPSWSLFKNLITPHPLGGCGMGESDREGVVDHLGEVFGYPGLYVVDGAILPQALGLNPSRTIAALAERCAEKMPL